VTIRRSFIRNDALACSAISIIVVTGNEWATQSSGLLSEQWINLVELLLNYLHFLSSTLTKSHTPHDPMHVLRRMEVVEMTTGQDLCAQQA
jgi:hypothetical protein